MRHEKHEAGATPSGGVSTRTVWDDETGDAEIAEYDKCGAVLARHEWRVFAALSPDGSVGELISVDATGVLRRRLVAGPQPGREDLGEQSH